MSLEDKLAPLRIRPYSDDQPLRMDALPDEVFVGTDDLPVEEWPARRG